jgi:hypothetical protein
MAAIVVTIVAGHARQKQASEREDAGNTRLYRQRAEQGDANAQYELGQMYARGQGVPRDYVQAYGWYQKAASQGSAHAEYAIGCLYYYGYGQMQSYTDALAWYRKAADHGNAWAIDAIGSMNFYGYGMPQSNAEAAVWYKKAADLGYARAEYDIGYMYSRGLGVARNREAANRWYRKAADQGYKNAQQALGLRLAPSKWCDNCEMLGIIAGTMFLSDFLRRRKTHSGRKTLKGAIAGIVLLLWAAMDGFQHSEYGLFPSAFAAIAFRAATFFLAGISVALLVTVYGQRSRKPLLIFSGIVFAAVNLSLCARAHFDPQILSAIGGRILALNALPLGMAISTIYWVRSPDKTAAAAAELQAGNTGTSTPV